MRPQPAQEDDGQAVAGLQGGQDFADPGDGRAEDAAGGGVVGCDDARRQRTEIGWTRGVAEGDDLHPLQQQFLQEAALQCGICTPGFIVAAKSLLERNPNPTETEMRYWLAGNLCRCTGYDKIVRAVLQVSKAK